MLSLARLSFTALYPSHTQFLSRNRNKARQQMIELIKMLGESSDISDDTNKMENDRQYIIDLPIFLDNRHTNN